MNIILNFFKVKLNVLKGAAVFDSDQFRLYRIVTLREDFIPVDKSFYRNDFLLAFPSSAHW